MIRDILFELCCLLAALGIAGLLWAGHVQRQYVAELQQVNSSLAEQIKTLSAENNNLNTQIINIQNELLQYKHLEDQVLRSVPVSRGGKRPKIAAVYNVSATAYGNHPINGGSGDGLVATGGRPIEGDTIAVDPDLIPLNSKVVVDCPSYPEINGVKTASDTGGNVIGNDIDVYFDDMTTDPVEAHHRMMRFGTREATVYILQD